VLERGSDGPYVTISRCLVSVVPCPFLYWQEAAALSRQGAKAAVLSVDVGSDAKAIKVCSPLSLLSLSPCPLTSLSLLWGCS